MYIADIGNQLVVKRMPLSGGAHEPSCSSYEPPYELSGLGPLMRSAIKVDPTAGVASLKLDFSLSKRGQSMRSESQTEGKDSVKAESRKLSLRALLHSLWHESGLTEWTSHWSGKRHWWQVYHNLLAASGNMAVRGETFQDRLLLPEPFRAADKSAITPGMVATIGSGPAGLIAIEEVALMSVTEQWLPIEDAHEQVLVERLARLRSKSVKGLRFNLGRSKPMANATVSTSRSGPTALYIVPPGADETFETELADMIEARPDLTPWIWRVADGEMPPLPA